MSKPSIPKGTRDFTSAEMVRRNYIFDTIRSVFTTFGYMPIETPAMENLSSLLGKYGDEGDKLLFRIINSGEPFTSVSQDVLRPDNSGAIVNAVCEKGLRYDLTVPFARFVVQHQNELTFPFRRYQIQPVWRADRPQKGRYREFYQCDVDVIGSKSLLNEVELVQIVDTIFNKLNINVQVKINNRKILSGVAEVIGYADKLVDITVAIDKIDKIGLEAVKEELRLKGIADEAIAKLEPILLLEGTTQAKLRTLEGWLTASEVGMLGVEELKTLFAYLDALSMQQEVQLDLSLARGLSYYTGAIFEVKAKDTPIGSITGGGRYDDLTGIFGLRNMSGVGISFGADRIYDVMTALNLFPEGTMQSTQVLFANMGEKEELYILPLAAELRSAGIAVEVYPDRSKLKKQLEYADKRSIPFVVVVGENELQKGVVMLKSMRTGEQVEYGKDTFAMSLASIMQMN